MRERGEQNACIGRHKTNTVRVYINDVCCENVRLARSNLIEKFIFEKLSRANSKCSLETTSPFFSLTHFHRCGWIGNVVTRLDAPSAFLFLRIHISDQRKKDYSRWCLMHTTNTFDTRRSESSPRYLSLSPNINTDQIHNHFSRIVVVTMKSFMSLIFALVCVVASVNAFTSVAPTNFQSSTALDMTVLTYNGKKKNFRAGSPMKNAASALGVKPRYSCKKGDCNSCTLSVGGQRIKACVGKVPPEPKLKSLQEKGLEVR